MLMPLRSDCGHLDTQGVALGYVLVGLSGRKPCPHRKKKKSMTCNPTPSPSPWLRGGEPCAQVYCLNSLTPKLLISSPTRGGVLAGRTIAGAVGNKWGFSVSSRARTVWAAKPRVPQPDTEKPICSTAERVRGSFLFLLSVHTERRKVCHTERRKCPHRKKKSLPHRNKK